ncbi:nucleoside-diphosphate-sugar epimerase [Oxalobacteraceae bacterium GrIS 2.11]
MDIQQNHPLRVGVLGATSFVGASLIQRLKNTTMTGIAFTRRDVLSLEHGVEWHKLESAPTLNSKNYSETEIPLWVSLAPIAVLPKYFHWLEARGVRRIVVLSSTSRFTKITSSDPSEQILVKHLAESELRVQQWAETRAVEWIILRPTLIYGCGQDRNIAEITRFIRRFGFFPILGKACGLRQPIHVQDVAGACLASLQSPTSVNRAYNISGDETLTYREMVTRIFTVLDRKPRLISIPLWMFRAAVFMARSIPRYRKWSSAMAERMNCDMVFDHSDVKRDFEFQPRKFSLSQEDLPI